jgi:hypothetical protein
MEAARAGVVGARCTFAVGLDESLRVFREQIDENKCKPILCSLMLKLLLEWVMMRSGRTVALLCKRLSDAFVSVCSKGASAGGLCAADWRGVPGQQAVTTGVHSAE